MKAYLSKIFSNRKDGWQTKKFKLNFKIKLKRNVVIIAALILTFIVCLAAYFLLSQEEEEVQIITPIPAIVEISEEEKRLMNNKKADEAKVNIFNKKLAKLKKESFTNYKINVDKVLNKIPLPKNNIESITCYFEGCDFIYKINSYHTLIYDWLKSSKFKLSEILDDRVSLKYYYRTDESKESKESKEVSVDFDPLSLEGCSDIELKLSFIDNTNNKMVIQERVKNSPFSTLKTDIRKDYKNVNEIIVTLITNKITNQNFKWLESKGFYIESFKLNEGLINFTGYLYCLEE